jgi:hypothetical protein
MFANEPKSVDEINEEYLTALARKMLGDASVEVTSFKVIADPFEFPRFGAKEFYEIPFSYQSASGPGQSAVILRVMPEMDAVMMLTGDTEHRELKAFKMGLFDEVPSTFRVPYIHVIDKPGQHWAFLEDVRAHAASDAREVPGRDRAAGDRAPRRSTGSGSSATSSTCRG